MSGFSFDHLPPAERLKAAMMELRAWRRHCAEQYMNDAEIVAFDMAIDALTRERVSVGLDEIMRPVPA